MNKFLMALVVGIMSLTLGLSTAEAKRMGGGGSFGKQSASPARSAPMQNSQATAPTKSPAAAAPSSPWRGMLGGALLGLGLGALLSHFGMGGALASMISTILMVALLAFAALFLYRMLTRKSAGQQPRPAFAGISEKNMTPEIGANLPASAGHATSVATAGSGIPADFDTSGFLRHAKTNFLRMQAAWDKAEVQDIREFTTPEMFAELKMQLTERGVSPNHTDVVTLDAELLGIETNESDYLASVRFTGMIREYESAVAEPFNEIWNLTKPISGGGWLLAGLQQA